VVKFCVNCGTRINPGQNMCSSCGAKTQLKTETAPGTGGQNPTPETTALPGPAGGDIFRIILDFLKQFIKDPKQLIPILVLGAVWLLLSLLSALGINSWPVRLLSFLTFAQGGMYAGVWGALGGIIGKAVFAYFFTVLIMPLFRGKNPFKEMGTKGVFAGLTLQGAAAVADLILGTGLALILFNFFTGNASWINSMAGIVGFVLALKALWNKGGVLRTLVFFAANRLGRGKAPSPATFNRVAAGYAAGSVLGVALSAFTSSRLFYLSLLPHSWQSYLPYILGAILFATGLIMSITTKSGKAVPVA